VSAYLDWFRSSEDERVEKITIRQLLNHTSGIIRDGVDSNYWQQRTEFPDEQGLRNYIATSELVYESDTTLKYSNYGYGYLGMVIAHVAGMSYENYVKDHIIEPLSLPSTGPDINESTQLSYAKGYGSELFHRKRREFKNVKTNALVAATGFYSTAEDLCRYFSAHFFGNTTLLSDASKRKMQHGNWSTAGPDSKGYGYGMMSFPVDGWKLRGHSGGFPGFTTHTRFDPEKEIVVAVFTNSYDGPVAQICKKIIAFIDTFQQDTDGIALPVKSLKKFEGSFYSTRGPEDIVAVGKKLFELYPLNWGDFTTAEELTVINETTLKITKASEFSASGELIHFEFYENGVAKKIISAGATMVPLDTAIAQHIF
jgi:D-alanyl-D-alanine carboxypeptidase